MNQNLPLIPTPASLGSHSHYTPEPLRGLRFQHLPEDKTYSLFLGSKDLGLMESLAVRTDGGKSPFHTYQTLSGQKMGHLLEALLVKAFFG